MTTAPLGISCMSCCITYLSHQSFQLSNVVLLQIDPHDCYTRNSLSRCCTPITDGSFPDKGHSKGCVLDASMARSTSDGVMDTCEMTAPLLFPSARSVAKGKSSSSNTAAMSVSAVVLGRRVPPSDGRLLGSLVMFRPSSASFNFLPVRRDVLTSPNRVLMTGMHCTMIVPATSAEYQIIE